MKSGNLLLGLLACAAMCACTDNDLIENGANGGSQTFTGETAYMIVNINEVGSTSTATRGSDGSLQAGTGTESTVNDIHFYLYDSGGTFLTQSTRWSGTGTDENNGVELVGDDVVAISGLTGLEYPAYMVTVINVPADFSAPESLEGWTSVLASASGTGIQQSDGYFTMCSSSYFVDDESSDDHDNTYYFATPVSEKNFTNELLTDIPSPITVYVERLAAKVHVKSDIHYTMYVDGMEQSSVTVNDCYGIIGLPSDSWSISEDLLKKIWRKNNTDNEITQIDYEPLFRFIGWDLNGTEKESYMVKNISEEWNDSYTGWTSFNWNDATLHRSYWGKSVHYGDSDVAYPTKASQVTEDSYLKYISADDIADGNVGGYYSISDMGYRYCAENTNTTDVIDNNKSSTAITNIIVKAQLFIGYPHMISYDETDGPESVTVAPASNLVMYGSDLYFEDAYLIHALNYITSPIYVQNGEGNYEEIDYTYLTLEDLGDGYVEVVIKSTITDEEGNETEVTYYKDDAGTTAYTTEEINAIIESQFGAVANGYTDGLMYYNIPIEHLNAPEGTDDIEEAQYGVVRNHSYVVTINSVDNIGRGIVDTDEPIIPQGEANTYYVGAQVNVLSWKEVDQQVAF